MGRMRLQLRAIDAQLRRRMHVPGADTGKWLRSVVQGGFNYHAVPRNSQCLDRFRTQVCRLWLAVLRRRSQRGRRWRWDRMSTLIRWWIPRTRILHPYPNQRLHVVQPR